MARKEYIVEFKNGLSKGLSTFSDNIQLVNYFNLATPNERSSAQLIDIAGSDSILTLTPENGTGCRGLWMASTGPNSTGYIATLYGVFGNTLYRINKNNTAVRIGYLSNRVNAVTFAENQDQTLSNTFGFVCDGTTVYKWDLKAEDNAIANSFVEIEELPIVNGTESERAIAKYITYNTYRLILTTSNSIQWFYSGINNSVFEGFESSESNPDKTVRAISFGGNIWVFSNYSYDIFSYTGSSVDPFDVGSGSTGKIGCANGDTIATHGDFMFWLGQGETSNSSVYMASVGGSIKEISTTGIKNILNQWDYKNFTRGFAFTDRGHTFYVLTSKLDNYSLVYCANTDTWHRRSSSINGTLTYWDVINVVNAYDKVYFGTNNSNKLCEFNYEQITDYNENPITRYWQSPVYIDKLDLFKILELKLDVECGTTKDVNYIPEVYIQLSWDGGKTWGERMLRSLGRVGDYARQVVIYGGGAGRNLVMRIGTSSNIPITLYQIKLILETAGRT